jgi:DNA-binding MarR family transcriptional regulator
MLQPTTQPRVTRQLSQRAVFEGLLHKGPISRADLSKATGLSKQTISEVVDEFERRGWARPIGRTRGNIGQRRFFTSFARTAAMSWASMSAAPK